MPYTGLDAAVRLLDPHSDGLIAIAILSGILASIYPILKRDPIAAIGTLILGPLCATGILAFLWGMQVT